MHDANPFSVAAWLIQYLVFDQRFMPIFCMLFGAGVILLVSRREDRPGLAAYFHIRMGVLLLIGVAHAYLLWPGDNLITYAGTYAELFRYNAWRNQFLQWTALPYFRVWNALGLMLIGMGLFKLGVLQATKPPRAMRRLAICGERCQQIPASTTARPGESAPLQRLSMISRKA